MCLNSISSPDSLYAVVGRVDLKPQTPNQMAWPAMTLNNPFGINIKRSIKSHLIGVKYVGPL